MNGQRRIRSNNYWHRIGWAYRRRIRRSTGPKVALAEKNRVGGDCTWTGCVPSKSLLKAAKIAHDMRNAHRFGIGTAEPQVDLKAAMARVKGVVEKVYQEESPEKLRALGIEVFLGLTRFLDDHNIETGAETLTGRRFLIATGARPAIPPISGMNDVDFLTYETLWDQRNYLGVLSSSGEVR